MCVAINPPSSSFSKALFSVAVAQVLHVPFILCMYEYKSVSMTSGQPVEREKGKILIIMGKTTVDIPKMINSTVDI